MFGNRRGRATSNPPISTINNVSAAAATAASSAFLSHRSSNSSLSSAAAAAALRARPTTPTSVADVQTKRTIRRTGSNSSAGSSVAGSVRGPPGSALVRRGSSGSMTERTFREQSPSRSSPVPSAADAPPVPAIPKNINPSIVPARSSRRASSMDAPGLRIASPSPSQSGGRGSSLGPMATTTSSPRRAGTSSLSAVPEMNGVSRPDNRGSVNFSLPTNSRPTSPFAQARLTVTSANPRIVSPNNKNLVYDPNTRSFLPLVEILAIEQSLNDVANAPVKKKKRIATKQVEGTHLADGTVGGRLRGTAVGSMAESAKAQSTRQDTSQQPKAQSGLETTTAPMAEPSLASQGTFDTPALAATERKKKKKQVIISDTESDQGSILPYSSDDSDAPIQQRNFNTRAAALLAKKPSVVREDREREEQEDDSPKGPAPGIASLTASHEAARTISPSPLPRSTVGRGHGRAQASAAFAQDRQHSRSASLPAPVTAGPAPVINGTSSPAKASAGGRVSSLSPARTAQFITTPETLLVRHQPPPRSLSPRKSAMKHSSNSPRVPSPIDGSFPRLSDVSNDGSSVNEEQPRKKGNRVSFDETSNVVLGQSTPIASDSPVVPSPQTSKRWFSLGREKKKNVLATEDNDDEIMKPRPALPSFGSVREKKIHREPEERPLVRPPEPVQASTSINPPSSTTLSAAGGAVNIPLGQSHDHAVGAIISQDAASGNTANISKSREPLPPEVTSVEGTGDFSDASSTYSLEDSENMGSRNGRNASDDDTVNEELPEIALQQPTPTLENTKTKSEWLGMPGGFPHSGSSSSDSWDQEGIQTTSDTGVRNVDFTAVAPLVVQLSDTEPELLSHHTGPILEETEESDSESIYSDAAEDFTDKSGDDVGEDGAFMSLDAVVESPVSEAATDGSYLGTEAHAPDSPASKALKERAYMRSRLERKSSEPDPDEGWERAQQYWKGLSDERKKQLESEAQRDLDAEAEAEVEGAPVLKTKEKRKVAIASDTPPMQRQLSEERTYMIQPGAKAGPNGHATVMRSSMRAETPRQTSDIQIRKSMRGPGSMRSGLRHVQAPPTSTLKPRPVSLPSNHLAVSKQLQQMARSSSPAASPVTKAATSMPQLRRKGSGDSDSSFKRVRPATDGISLRRSMRGGNEQTSNGRQQSPMRSARLSLRLASPGGPPPVNMRTSMRNSKRNPHDPSSRGKSPVRLPSFGRSSSARPATNRNSVASRGSRFDNSSDEDEPRRAFRSRFVDSSDEDEPSPVVPSPVVARPKSNRGVPVRSIPRPAGYEDGDSSDLPDSDDDRPATARSSNKLQQNGTRPGSQGKALASGTLQRSGSGRGTMINAQSTFSSASPLRKAKTGGIMSIFRKKADPKAKVQKSNAESAARRDTPLERSQSELAIIKNSAGSPPSPKLQKRNPYATTSRQNSGSWPLSNGTDSIEPIKMPTVVNGNDGRPFSADTAGGVVGGENKIADADPFRPDIGVRSFTATGLSDVDVTGQGSARKKKKFQALRKMFKLDD